MTPRFLLLITIACAAPAMAYEDDLLLDVSPSAVFQTGTDVENPDLGGTVGLTWGLSDRTDLGGYFHFDDIQRKGIGTPSGNLYASIGGPKRSPAKLFALGAQSWYTPVFGYFRPQSGARIGMSFDPSGSPSLDLAFQARILAQFTSSLRGFAGGVVGADYGRDPRTFVGLDLGFQIAL